MLHEQSPTTYVELSPGSFQMSTVLCLASRTQSSKAELANQLCKHEADTALKLHNGQLEGPQLQWWPQHLMTLEFGCELYNSACSLPQPCMTA